MLSILRNVGVGEPLNRMLENNVTILIIHYLDENQAYNLNTIIYNIIIRYVIDKDKST